MLIVSNEAAGSIAFAQIYGMKNDLTNRIVDYNTTESGFTLVVKVHVPTLHNDINTFLFFFLSF